MDQNHRPEKRCSDLDKNAWLEATMSWNSVGFTRAHTDPLSSIIGMGLSLQMGIPCISQLERQIRENLKSRSN